MTGLRISVLAFLCAVSALANGECELEITQNSVATYYRPHLVYCRVVGCPPIIDWSPHLFWTNSSNARIPRYSNNRIFYDSFEGGRIAVLKFLSVGTRDQGIYKCKGNFNGIEKTKEFNLNPGRILPS